MDYKEKYEQALGRANTKIETYNHLGNASVVKSICEIFPELKENEDERIRKELIKLMKQMSNTIVENYTTIDISTFVDWLEKQGKKIDVIENFDTEFEKQISHLIASTFNKEYEYTSDFVKWTANALLNYAKHELEKQDEQKPIDIDNSVNNIVFPCKAKVKSSGAVVTIHDGQLSDDGKEWIKYQSNKDDGYRVYNPENLEFICNLENEINKINPTSKVNDCILDENGFIMQIEQKPAWSEEDEKMWTTVSDLLWEGYKLSDEKVSWFNIKYWLLPKITCFKDRVQQQLNQEWSEEDERYYDSALWHIKNSCGKEGVIYNWLKSIKERMKGE